MNERSDRDALKEDEVDKKESKSFLMNLLKKSKDRNNKKGGVADEDELLDKELHPKTEEVKPKVQVPEPLLMLRREWYGSMGGIEGEPSLTDFVWDERALDNEEEMILVRLAREAMNGIQKPVKKDEEPKPVNASIRVGMTKDAMRAWIFLRPPLYNGEDVTLEQVHKELEWIQVKHGLDEKLLQYLVESREYLKFAVIASGNPPTDGVDGEIVEVIPSTAGRPNFDGTEEQIDFKNLNWLIPVEEGDVLCNIIPPTLGTDGITVQGRVVHGKNGRKAEVPMGTNTVVNEEGTSLIAKASGQVFYDNNKYRVDQLISIDGDVDLATGNIKVTGNLRIRGNIREGFVVQASGDINVQGMVEGATVIAGGSIFVSMGMNGNYHGTMDAGRDIKCRYLENSAIRASGNVYMESVINSTIVSDDKVVVTSGRGVIIGGSITALNQIEAKTIGNDHNRTTILILGSTPHFIQEKARIAEELSQVEQEISELEQQIRTLEQSGELDREMKIKPLNLKLSVVKMKEGGLRTQEEELTAKDQGIEKCRAKVGTLFPVVQITIGKATRVITGKCVRNFFYLAENDVQIGQD